MIVFARCCMKQGECEGTKVVVQPTGQETHIGPSEARVKDANAYSVKNDASKRLRQTKIR